MAFSRLFIIAVAAGCLCVNSSRLKRNQEPRFSTRSSDIGKAESEEEVPGACSLGYRATKQDSELLIVGSVHNAEFDTLAWRPALETEILRLTPTAGMFENENINLLPSLLPALESIAKDSERIVATEDADDALKVDWLQRLQKNALVVDLIQQRGISEIPSNASAFSGFTTIIEALFSEVSHLSHGVDASLAKQMSESVREVHTFETSAEANGYMAHALQTMHTVNPDLLAQLKEVVPKLPGAYRERDLGALCPMIDIIYECMAKRMEVKTRNLNWARQVIDKQPARGLVVVGLAHLVDTDGDKSSMLDVFEAHGYKVEPVPFSPTIPVSKDPSLLAADAMTWDYVLGVIGGPGLHNANTNQTNLWMSVF